MVTKQKIGSLFFYTMAIIFSLGLVGVFWQSGITTKNLELVTGIVHKTEVVTIVVPSRGHNVQSELRLFLKDSSEYFRISDVYKFERFRDRIQEGDSAEIFIRPKLLQRFFLGQRNDIMHLNINGQIIVDVVQTRKIANAAIIVGIAAIIVFLLLAIFGGRIAKIGVSTKS